MCGTQQRSWGQELAIYIPTGLAAADVHTNCTALGSAPPPLQGMSLAAGVDLQDIARCTEGYRWAAAGWPRGCKDAACIFHFHFVLKSVCRQRNLRYRLRVRPVFQQQSTGTFPPHLAVATTLPTCATRRRTTFFAACWPAGVLGGDYDTHQSRLLCLCSPHPAMDAQ